MRTLTLIFGPRREKSCLRGFANNTGADQPAHPRSLISAFVIRVLESTISKLTASKISIFYLVSVAEETVLKLALSETPKTGFLATRPIFYFQTSEMTQVFAKFPGIILMDNTHNVCSQGLYSKRNFS